MKYNTIVVSAINWLNVFQMKMLDDSFFIGYKIITLFV